ncbi:putative GNAT family acetyltransferase [Serratia sp. PL17]|uniref:GNAT family N-acetyltransferase n=1 Tax=Serratia sp. PL17 TaxID=2806582 RepID=UPI001AE10789|nr:GNAT family N-acetyltransferase [Serratia sp. PL17]MBP1133589.1 putative GNAT family acetyltransferase [Serratia sp. PL17]
MDFEILADEKRFYINDPQGKMIAEISFVPSGDKLTIIDHTWVDEVLKGQGVSKKLVALVVAKMRAENRKIIPLCPFAKHEFDTTPDYQDIRA